MEGESSEQFLHLPRNMLSFLVIIKNVIIRFCWQFPTDCRCFSVSLWSTTCTLYIFRGPTKHSWQVRMGRSLFSSIIMVDYASLLLTLLSIVGIIQAFPNPMSCSGVCGNAHDPSILQNTDGTYYRFSTGGGIAIHTSPSLTGPWTYKGQALGASKIDGNTDLWVGLCSHPLWHLRLCWCYSRRLTLL